jgi:hypothetical protein
VRGVSFLSVTQKRKPPPAAATAKTTRERSLNMPRANKVYASNDRSEDKDLRLREEEILVEVRDIINSARLHELSAEEICYRMQKRNFRHVEAWQIIAVLEALKQECDVYE